MMKGDCRMSVRKTLAAVIVLGLAVTGCDYIVPPISEETPTQAIKSEGWSAIVTNVADANGALRVDLSLRNDTGDWSAMDIGASKAKVSTSDGKSTDCGKVFVGTSVFSDKAGQYLAPGFTMKGYTGGTKASPVAQLLYVECAGVAKAAGEKLSIDYAFITGPFNYYVPSKPFKATFVLELDRVVTDTKYPVATDIPNLIEKSDTVVNAINKCTVQLTDIKRTDTGFEFSWATTNPSEYQAYIHIGTPPVIGADGIIYGMYESPHLATTPITPAGGKAAWTTKVSVPKDLTGFYILLPVETKQQKYFVDHALDITAK
jgi:hypothetical protein